MTCHAAQCMTSDCDPGVINRSMHSVSNVLTLSVEVHDWTHDNMASCTRTSELAMRVRSLQLSGISRYIYTYIECFIDKIWLGRGHRDSNLELVIADDDRRLPVARHRRRLQLRVWWGWGHLQDYAWPTAPWSEAQRSAIKEAM